MPILKIRLSCELIFFTAVRTLDVAQAPWDVQLVPNESPRPLAVGFSKYASLKCSRSCDGDKDGVDFVGATIG